MASCNFSTPSATGSERAHGPACPTARAMPTPAIRRRGRCPARKTALLESSSFTQADPPRMLPLLARRSPRRAMVAFKQTPPLRNPRSRPSIPVCHGTGRRHNRFLTRAPSSERRTPSIRWGSTRGSAATKGCVKAECSSAVSTPRLTSRDSWRARRRRASAPRESCWLRTGRSLQSRFLGSFRNYFRLPLLSPLLPRY